MVKAFHLHIIGNQLDIPRSPHERVYILRHFSYLSCSFDVCCTGVGRRFSGTKDASIRTRSLVLESDSGNRLPQGNSELGPIFDPAIPPSSSPSTRVSARHRRLGSRLYRAHEDPQYQRNRSLYHLGLSIAQGSDCPINDSGTLASFLQHCAQRNSPYSGEGLETRHCGRDEAVWVGIPEGN
jgi:hypothetical protein